MRDATVQLQHYRILPDVPALTVQDGTLELSASRYYRDPVVVPAADCAVHELTRNEVRSQPTGRIVFEEPLELPYLNHTGNSSLPNVLLLFRQRQPVAKRYGRRRDGIVDGFKLRAVDARTAVRALTDAGVELVRDPDGWFAASGRQIVESATKRRMLARNARGQRQLVIALLVLIALDALALALIGSIGKVAVIPFAATAVVAVAFARLVRSGR